MRMSSSYSYDTFVSSCSGSLKGTRHAGTDLNLPLHSVWATSLSITLIALAVSFAYACASDPKCQLASCSVATARMACSSVDWLTNLAHLLSSINITWCWLKDAGFSLPGMVVL